MNKIPEFARPRGKFTTKPSTLSALADLCIPGATSRSFNMPIRYQDFIHQAGPRLPLVMTLLMHSYVLSTMSRNLLQFCILKMQMALLQIYQKSNWAWNAFQRSRKAPNFINRHYGKAGSEHDSAKERSCMFFIDVMERVTSSTFTFYLEYAVTLLNWSIEIIIEDTVSFSFFHGMKAFGFWIQATCS